MTQSHIRVAIITVSDRAAAGAYDDISGPALAKAVENLGWKVSDKCVLPDELKVIRETVEQKARDGCQLILTTGGTGISPRDVTPEAVRGIADKELPGFGELMRMRSLKKTPHAILSRSMAVTVERSLIICLPGKPSAAVECLGFVAEAIPHCVELLAGRTAH